MLLFNSSSSGSANSRRNPARQSGVTLVELVIAIVIISIASVALLQGLGFQTVRNVDPMIQSQAQLLAKQYLDEVLSRSYYDPSADPRLDPTLTNAEINASLRNQTRTGAPSRLSWDNLYEYHNYSGSIVDINGNAVAELTSYQVAINVDISDGLQLGTLTNVSVAGCPPKFALVSVEITDPRGQTTSLQGYRASYYRLTGC